MVEKDTAGVEWPEWPVGEIIPGNTLRKAPDAILAEDFVPLPIVEQEPEMVVDDCISNPWKEIKITITAEDVAQAPKTIGELLEVISRREQACKQRDEV